MSDYGPHPEDQPTPVSKGRLGAAGCTCSSDAFPGRVHLATCPLSPLYRPGTHAEMIGVQADAREHLRRVLMDYVPECDAPGCGCSAAAARRFLASGATT